jgi:hypothetical protein
VIGELAAAAGLSTFSAAGLGVKRVRKPRKHEHRARRNQRRRLLPLDLIGNVNAGRSRPTLPLLISPSALKHVFAASRPLCDSVRHSNRTRFLIHTAHPTLSGRKFSHSVCRKRDLSEFCHDNFS